jgi:hypothetical protein
MVPANVVEANIVSEQPKSPKSNAFQQSLVPTDVMKFARGALSKKVCFQSCMFQTVLVFGVARCFNRQVIEWHTC